MLRRLAILALAAGLTLSAVAGLQVRTGRAQAVGIHKIQHVVIIMQENRSFDSYFGTYPGADGIPMQDGIPTVCVPDPRTSQCVKPYHDTHDVNQGGPHGAPNSAADLDGGKMDGFIGQQEQGSGRTCAPFDPTCAAAVTTSLPDVMGYHTGADIPNYWAYAQNFVLQDHMFEPVASWSFPSHLYLVSGWSATCTSSADPMSCQSALQNPIQRSAQNPTPFAWTDLTYLLTGITSRGATTSIMEPAPSRWPARAFPTSGTCCPASSTCTRTIRPTTCRTSRTSSPPPKRERCPTSPGSSLMERTASIHPL